jgi:hypothetical protein
MNTDSKIKTVRGPKAAVATFLRSRDNVRIYVFAKTGETKEAAVQRVMARNGSTGATYQWVN